MTIPTGSRKSHAIVTVGLSMPVLWLLGFALLLYVGQDADISVVDFATWLILLLGLPILGVLLSGLGMVLALKARDSRKEYWHSITGMVLNGLLLLWICAICHIH